jgi:hypothetical protein
MKKSIDVRSFAAGALCAGVLVSAVAIVAAAQSPSAAGGTDHITGVSHIGLAVGDIDKTVADLGRVLAIPKPAIEDVKARQTKVAFVDIGGVELEVTQSYSEAGLKAARERGDVISHFCLTTKDIVADIATLQQRGVKFRDERPRVGLTKKWIAYTDNNTIGGLGFELLQSYPDPPKQ